MNPPWKPPLPATAKGWMQKNASDATGCQEQTRWTLPSMFTLFLIWKISSQIDAPFPIEFGDRVMRTRHPVRRLLSLASVAFTLRRKGPATGKNKFVKFKRPPKSVPLRMNDAPTPAHRAVCVAPMPKLGARERVNCQGQIALSLGPHGLSLECGTSSPLFPLRRLFPVECWPLGSPDNPRFIVKYAELVRATFHPAGPYKGVVTCRLY